MLKADCRRKAKRRSLLAPLILLSTLLAGCAPSAFFPPRFDNQIAYFNIYYNASRLFKEAIFEIENTEKSQRERGLPLQREISHNVRQKLTAVIEKCSRLLMYYPKSKWVDDALMLIGKSYYYMGEYPKAARKFTELLTQLPNSNLALEAHMWLGKTFRRDNDFDQAARVLKSAAEAAIAQREDEVAAQALLVLGEVHTERKSFQEAIAAYQELINRTDEDKLKAVASFRTGELYEKTEDYAKAAKAFRRVLAFKPEPYYRYAAQLRYAVNATRLSQYDEALKVLRGLLKDNSNAAFLPDILLEIANTLRASGDIEHAIEAYVTVDTACAKTEAAAKALYQLGLLYEKTLRNYHAADTNYVRARSEYPPSEVSSLAARRAENLRRYFLLKEAIRRDDSLLFREYQAQTKASEITSVENEESTSAGDSASDDTTGRLHFEIWGIAKQSAAMDNLRSSLARHTYELGTLFFLDLEEPDSALFWCNQTVVLSPDSELVARALYTIADIHRTYKPDDTSALDSIYNRIISDYPQTTYADEVRRILGMEVTKTANDPAADVYREAEKLIEAKRTDEAIALLQKLIKDYPESPLAPKARYAIGWIYENIENRPDSALANYRVLLARHPSSTYAAVAGKKVAEVERKQMEENERRDSVETEKEAAEDRVFAPSGYERWPTTPADTSFQTPRPLEPEGEVKDSLFVPKSIQPFRRTKPDTSKVILE